MKTKRFLTVFTLLALLLVAPTKAAQPTVVTMNIDGYVSGCHEAVHITGEVTQLLQQSITKTTFYTLTSFSMGTWTGKVSRPEQLTNQTWRKPGREMAASQQAVNSTTSFA